MAKKYVQVNGLHNVFDSIADMESGNIKLTVADLADEYTILYITCDATDATSFGAPYYAGTKVIYTRGTSYLQTGEFVKSVNNTTPDATGNVAVSGGGEVPVIDMGTSSTTYTIDPNKVYVWGEVTSLDITLATPASTSVVNHYFFQFTSGTTPTTLSLPDDLYYIGDSTIVANRIYQISILNNVAKIGGAQVSIIVIPAIVDFNVTTDIGTTVASNTETSTYTVTDDQGGKETFSVVGGGSTWSVTSGSYSYTINGDSYTSSYQLYLEGTGSTTSRNIQVDLTGPCTIYIAARSSSTRTSRTISCYVDGTSIGTCTSGTSTVSTGTISYTGTGGTLTIYANGACYFYHIRIDYNV